MSYKTYCVHVLLLVVLIVVHAGLDFFSSFLVNSILLFSNHDFIEVCFNHSSIEYCMIV